MKEIYEIFIALICITQSTQNPFYYDFISQILLDQKLCKFVQRKKGQQNLLYFKCMCGKIHIKIFFEL